MHLVYIWSTIIVDRVVNLSTHRRHCKCIVILAYILMKLLGDIILWEKEIPQFSKNIVQTCNIFHMWDLSLMNVYAARPSNEVHGKKDTHESWIQDDAQEFEFDQRATKQQELVVVHSLSQQLHTLDDAVVQVGRDYHHLQQVVQVVQPVPVVQQPHVDVDAAVHVGSCSDHHQPVPVIQQLHIGVDAAVHIGGCLDHHQEQLADQEDNQEDYPVGIDYALAGVLHVVHAELALLPQKLAYDKVKNSASTIREMFKKNRMVTYWGMQKGNANFQENSYKEVAREI
ncbi:hypothetical protein BDN67DRAFT_984971 [Paxillus ammoniavirescens]|nr:hypothetical protein BDN67DRAFT_984971 [Paxillus ammoniavirescens]